MTRTSKATGENGIVIPGTTSGGDNDQGHSYLKRSLSRIASYQQEIREQQLPMPATKGKSVKNVTELQMDFPQVPVGAEIALVALQYLPTPVIVLTSLKTILLANEAMGRLLGLEDKQDQEKDEQDIEPLSGNTLSVTDMLRGQTLSQIGVDILQDGIPIWVSWDKFLDNLSNGIDNRERPEEKSTLLPVVSGETTPIATSATHTGRSRRASEPNSAPRRDETVVHDTVVDVMVSSQHNKTFGSSGRNRHHIPRSPASQTPAKLIISIWHIEGEKFFSLSFTSTSTAPHKSHLQSHVVPRATVTTSISRLNVNPARSSTPTSSRSSSSHSCAVVSPSEPNSNAAPFLPYGAPSKCLQLGTFTEFQKITRMKDAMLSAMEIPVLAMWKDESVVFPNPAARRMLAVVADPTTEDSYDFISRFKANTPDFERALRLDEFPTTALCRDQKGFSNWKIGMVEPRTGKR
jgi:hypothetical protein